MKNLEKMSLANMKSQLSRSEMRNIMAGSGGPTQTAGGGGGGFFGDLVKTVVIDVIYNYGIKPLASAVANDYNSRPGTPASQTDRVASMGPY